MTKSSSSLNNNPLLLVARPLSAPLITETIMIPIITLTQVSLQSPTMSILIRRLQPQPARSLLTNSHALNPAALGQQLISRKALNGLNPHTTFIVTASLHLLGLFLLLLPSLDLPSIQADHFPRLSSYFYNK